MDHKLNATIIRQTTPTASPPLYTNFSSSTSTWKFVSLVGLKIYAEDGSSTSGDISIIKHNASLPIGISDINGAGYICDSSCIQDHNLPFKRLFTNTDTNIAPTLTPNIVGELALNTTTNIWWKANSPSTWVKL